MVQLSAQGRAGEGQGQDQSDAIRIMQPVDVMMDLKLASSLIAS